MYHAGSVEHCRAQPFHDLLHVLRAIADQPEASWPALEKGMLDYFVSAEDEPSLWMARIVLFFSGHVYYSLASCSRSSIATVLSILSNCIDLIFLV